MSKIKYVYLAVRPDGYVEGACIEGIDKQDTAETLKEWILSGCHIERVTEDDARKRFMVAGNTVGI